MEYSKAEMDFMRKDALRRAREMHSRAGPAAENTESKAEEADERDVPPKARKEPELPFLGGLLPDMGIDSDRLMILVLIMILAREGTDIKLLTALFYIMM